MELDFLQVSFLAIIQGLTEFLPISSSAHLILPSLLLGWNDQGLTFDVAVHLGTLLAVLIYFRIEIRRLAVALSRHVVTGNNSADAQLAWLIIIATVPAAIGGFLLNDLIEEAARSLPVIAATSLLFALLLFWADRTGLKKRNLSDLNWKHALFIGVAQAVALIPGTSRSGITMTAALFCQLSREASAKFSFLLAIPIIFGSGLFRASKFATQAGHSIELLTLLYATLLSALIAFSCIHYFLRLIDRIGFVPFVVYRVVLSLFLIALYVRA
ncbi:MAG: undecaprenyl-diphosphate phosphatase [Proteobacteria bacterium]|nr:undecaprenyl-diphosphate phosphatase [Pseudomonadota bacterium]